MDSAPMKKLIDDLNAQIADPTPTPPVGTTVIWYKRADISDPYAALVTKVEAAGKVTLTVFVPFAVPTHTRGALHVTNPIHKLRANSVSVNSGSWDYVSGVRPPKSHFDLDVANLTKRRDELVIQLVEAEAIAAKESKKPVGAK